MSTRLRLAAVSRAVYAVQCARIARLGSASCASGRAAADPAPLAYMYRRLMYSSDWYIALHTSQCLVVAGSVHRAVCDETGRLWAIV